MNAAPPMAAAMKNGTFERERMRETSGSVGD
jgi:hypothetical protein